MTPRTVYSTVVFIVTLTTGSLRAQTCEKLAKLASPTVSITLAKTIDGSFTPGEGAKEVSGLPAFCRVAVTLKPTSDSDIHSEIWLPVSGWNGKFLMVGTSGWGGSIGYGGMATALRRGYATSATDDGHTGGNASFAVGHPEKLIDYGYRAVHETAVETKTLIKAFYGHDAQHSYWDGCSAGGREGLIQAARYPDEFDGIIAGDPANIRRNGWALELATETFLDPASYIPPKKYPMIHRAVLDACDAKDGLKDGLIEDPDSCHVDLKPLQCKAADGPDCLTARQVQTAETIMKPIADSAGKVLFPRVEPGTELRWARFAGGPAPADLFLDEYRYVVHQDPNWDWKTFNLEVDAAKAHAIDKDVDEVNPDLVPFAKRGGKLLMYHGWGDQQVAPSFSVDFYNSAISLSDDPAPTSNWIRLFMVPGMGHCSGGEGPDVFNTMGPLEQWVEQGKAPAQIVASHKTDGKVDRTRPLCPYPQIARYDGSGSIDDAANFSCSAR